MPTMNRSRLAVNTPRLAINKPRVVITMETTSIIPYFVADSAYFIDYSYV